MNSFDCLLVQNGTFCEKKWNTYCFLHQYFAFVIVLLGESFWRVNLSCLTSSSWNLFSILTRPFFATSKLSLQRSVACKLHHSDCNVWCGDISYVCYVLSVTVCVHWFCHCIVTKHVEITFSIYFESMLNITIKVNAFGCRPENGRFPFMYSGTNWCILWWDIELIIYAYLNLFNFFTSLGEHCTHFFCRFIAMDKERFWLTHWWKFY